MRATKDADANWRATLDQLDETMSGVEEADVGDWFAFVIGDARPLQGEGDEGALRFPVTALLDGRVFEQIITDYPLRWPDIDRAFDALQRFWQPLFDQIAAGSPMQWSPSQWAWG